MLGPEHADQGRLGLRAWRLRIFVVSWLTYATFYLGRVNLAAALPALQDEFGWSKALLGVMGSAFYWVYAAGQLVNGHIGDRVSARRFVALGLSVSALLNILFGSLDVFWVLVAIWALNGWAQSTGWGPIMKTLSRWFSPQQRGRLIAWFTPCYVVGHALSWALAGWLLSAGGWRYAFWVPGAILLGAAGLWYALVRDAPTPPEDNVPASLPPQGPVKRQPLRVGEIVLGTVSNLRHMVSHPKLGCGLLVCFLSGAIKDGLTLWGPTYLVEQQGLAPTAAALMGTVLPMAGALGAVAAGWFMHRVSGEREMPVVAGMSLVIVCAVLGLYLLGAGMPWWAALAMLAVLALGSHGMNALLMASLPLSLGPEGNVSSAAGTLDFASYVGGGLSAVLVGGLQDALGWGAVYVWWGAVALAIGAVSLAQVARQWRRG